MVGMLFWLATLVYLAGAGAYLSYIIWQKDRASVVGCWLMAVGLVVHTTQIITAWIQMGHIPAVSLGQSMNIFAWSVAAAYLLIRFRADIKVLGSFVAPLTVFLMFMAGTGFDEPTETVSGFSSVWLVLHVTFAFLGDGVFAVAFMAGIMYLLQEREIRGKRFGWLYSRLPSLTSLDNINRICLIYGFPLLTIGMIIGVFYAQLSTGSYWRWEAKETWSLITWTVYAVLLHQRLTVGWQGSRAAWMAIIGFGFVLFTFLGASLLLSGYHDFYSYGRAQ